MSHDGTLIEEQIRTAVTDAGLDWEKIVARIAADDITATIRQNLQIAQRLQINGTPTFVIGDRILPGFVEADELARLLPRLKGRWATHVFRTRESSSHKFLWAVSILRSSPSAASP